MILLGGILLISTVCRIAGQTTSAYGPPYTECPPPLDVPNSYFDTPPPWNKNTDIKYLCDPGYQIGEGDGWIVCRIVTGGDSYSWDMLGSGPFPPVCRWIYLFCPLPPNITLGYFDATEPVDGEVAEYVCDFHYAPNGTEEATCDITDDQFNYTWITDPVDATDFPPECVYSYWDCPTPGAIVGGYIDPPGPWADNDVMQYKCDPGLVLVGGDIGTCHISADTFSYWWTYEPASYPDWPPKCVVGYDFCLTPGAITNGFISLTTPDPWAPTDTVEYECDSHYKMFGTKDAECFIPYDKQNYYWNTTPLGLPDFPPNCIYRYDDCPTPGDLVVNGVNDPPGPWVDNQILDYVCDEFYIDFGADKVECDISDNETTYEWHITPGNLGTTFVPAVCKLATCGAPPHVANGMARPQQVLYDNLTTVVFVCEPGYRLKGVRYIICEIDMNVNLTWRWVPEAWGKKGSIYPPICYLHIPHPEHYIGHNDHEGIPMWLTGSMMTVSLISIPILLWLIGCVIWWLFMRFRPCARRPVVIRRIPFSHGRKTHLFHVKPPGQPATESPQIRHLFTEPGKPELAPDKPSPAAPTSNFVSDFSRFLQSHPAPRQAPEPTNSTQQPPSPVPSPKPGTSSPVPPSPDVTLSPCSTPSVRSVRPRRPRSPVSAAPASPPTATSQSTPAAPSVSSSVRRKRPIKKSPKPLNLPDHPDWKPHQNPVRNDAYHMGSSTK